jgi:hypothetical protein
VTPKFFFSQTKHSLGELFSIQATFPRVTKRSGGRAGSRVIKSTWTIFGSVRLSYNLYFSICFFVRIMFFSHNKSANGTFSRGFSAKRTSSLSITSRDMSSWIIGSMAHHGSQIFFFLRSIMDLRLIFWFWWVGVGGEINENATVQCKRIGSEQRQSYPAGGPLSTYLNRIPFTHATLLFSFLLHVCLCLCGVGSRGASCGGVIHHKAIATVDLFCSSSRESQPSYRPLCPWLAHAARSVAPHKIGAGIRTEINRRCGVSQFR